MIQFSSSIVAAVARLRVLPYSAEFATLPEHTQNHIMEAIGQMSPVDIVVKGFEVLWAVRANLGEESRSIAADLAYQIVAGSFHNKSDRADAAMRHLRVDAGELPFEGLPEVPEPDSQYVSQAEPAA